MNVVFTTWFLQKHILLTNNILCVQYASPGLVDFAIRLVNSAFYLPDGQVMCFEEFE